MATSTKWLHPEFRQRVGEGFRVLLICVATDGQRRCSVLADAECRDESAPGAVVIEHAVGEGVNPGAVLVAARRLGWHRAGQLRISQLGSAQAAGSVVV